MGKFKLKRWDVTVIVYQSWMWYCYERGSVKFALLKSIMSTHPNIPVPLPIGWEKIVVDGKPFYQYYVNKNGRPWKKGGGEKVPSGKRTRTKPEGLKRQMIAKIKKRW